MNYARKYFYSLIDRHMIAAFYRKHIHPAFSVNILYNAVFGQRKFPPVRLMYRIRKEVDPSLWFYDETEPMPEKYDFSDTPDLWDWKRSVNYHRLINEYNLKEFCRQNGLVYTTVYSMLYSGKSITAQQIMKFRHVLRPAGWFVYVEEE